MAKGPALRYERQLMLQSGLPADEPSYLLLRDRLRGLFVLFGGLVVSFAITLWAKEQIRPRNAHGATVSSLRGVVGWPTQVDAVKTLEAARRFSGPRELRGMTLDGVKSDGTLDLEHGKNSVKYVFQSGKHRNQARPVPNKPAPAPWVCPRQVIKLRNDGVTAEPERLDANCPSNQGDPVPVPRCGPKEVWAKALTKGAPQEGVARLDYYRAKAGPVWKLQVAATRFQLSLSGDCKRELSLSEAAGKVP